MVIEKINFKARMDNRGNLIKCKCGEVLDHTHDSRQRYRIIIETDEMIETIYTHEYDNEDIILNEFLDEIRKDNPHAKITCRLIN